jgi:hypothetical protein
MSSYLLLGPVLFQDFELPERISWGGKQQLAVHRLPGGTRVIDALGRDDREITWSGVFSGGGGSARARLVDLMRADGSVWPLTWEAFFYSVVIASFDADYSRSNWIPYRITCTVLRDEAEAVVLAAASLAADALSDLTAAAGFNTGIDFSSTLTALAAPSAATLGAAAYGTALGSLTDASAQIDGSMATQEVVLNAATPDTADGLTQATGSAGSLAALADARGYVQRAVTNLQNAST